MTEIPTPDDLTGLRALAIAATPGARKVCGATIVWSPSSQAVICAASELYPPSGCVEYREPELGELAAPAANATFIAACDPQTIIGLLDAIDRLTRERDAAMAQVEAYREEDAEWNEGWTALEAERDAALAHVAQMRGDVRTVVEMLRDEPMHWGDAIQRLRAMIAPSAAGAP